MKNEFKPFGILPATVTPKTEDNRINEKALRRIIQYQIDGGVHGIFAVGTSGEFYGLTLEEYRELLAITKDEVKGRVPVYAGANAISTRDCISLANAAEDAGVDALSVLTPYFISITQEELVQHYETIARNTNVPIMLYNNLPRTHITITPSSVEKLALNPKIIGIKDSSGDMTNLAEYINKTRGTDFSVMVGRDTMIYSALCSGAKGAVAACANIAPKLCVEIYNRYQSGDLKGSLEAQFKLSPLRLAFTLGSFPVVVKEALNLLGFEVGNCIEPIKPLSGETRGELKKILIGMGLLQ